MSISAPRFALSMLSLFPTNAHAPKLPRSYYPSIKPQQHVVPVIAKPSEGRDTNSPQLHASRVCGTVLPLGLFSTYMSKTVWCTSHKVVRTSGRFCESLAHLVSCSGLGCTELNSSL